MMINDYFDLQQVKWVLRQHPTECVFELNAPEKILERLNQHPKDYWFSFGKYYINIEQEKLRNDEFRACWHQSEIYCPHEGIDRRKEYGIE
jgi:hypothetical protein